MLKSFHLCIFVEGYHSVWIDVLVQAMVQKKNN